MTMMKFAVTALILLAVSAVSSAQDRTVRRVALDGAQEVVAEINGGFGTLYLKRGSSGNLMTLKEKRKDEESDETDIDIDYHVEDGVGYLTVDLGTEGADDMNALACLLKGNSSRTWYVTISDP